MKKIMILILSLMLLKTGYAEEPKKEWLGENSAYVAAMQLFPGEDCDNLTVIMGGGEKPIYIQDKYSINFWHFEYIDEFVGYVYGGPSLYYEFSENSFIDIGVGFGITSENLDFIYATLIYGQIDKFGFMFNSEHDTWNWHRAWISYDINDYIGIMAGSHTGLGIGPGVKLSYEMLQLQAMYHIGIEDEYFSTMNNCDGLSMVLSIGL